MEPTWKWTSHGLADWRFDVPVSFADFQGRRRDVVVQTVETLLSLLPPFARPSFGSVDSEEREATWEGRMDVGALLDALRQHDVLGVRINLELLCDGPNNGLFTIPNGGDLRLYVTPEDREAPLQLTFTLNADIYSDRDEENRELAGLNATKLEGFLRRLTGAFHLVEVESHGYPEANDKGLGLPVHVIARSRPN
jgi:hypothetical protein